MHQGNISSLPISLSLIQLFLQCIHFQPKSGNFFPLENDGQSSQGSFHEEGHGNGSFWQGLRSTFTRVLSTGRNAWSRLFAIRIPRTWVFSERGRGATATETADSAKAEEAPIAQERSGEASAFWSRQQTQTVSHSNSGNLATHIRYQLTCLEERVQRLESHQSRTYRLVVFLKRSCQLQEQDIKKLMNKTSEVDAVEQPTMPSQSMKQLELS